jgi:hypothetical protein
MANWLKLNLGGGKFGDKQIVSEEKFKEMRTPFVSYKEMPFSFPEVLLTSYGLGWFIDSYRGHINVHHGGNVPGFTARVSFLPDENFGLNIQTNMNSTSMTHALQYEIFDRVLGVSGGNWSMRYKAEVDKMLEAAKKAKEEAENKRVKGTKPTLDLDAYCGEYEHIGYGKLIVTQTSEGYSYDADFNTAKLRFEHYHYDWFNLCIDTFDAELPSRFTIGKDGKVESVSVPFEAASGKDIVFKKK